MANINFQSFFKSQPDSDIITYPIKNGQLIHQDKNKDTNRDRNKDTNRDKNKELSPSSSPYDLSSDTEEESCYVITRTGLREVLDTNKIVKRLQKLTKRSPKISHINPYDLMLSVIQGLKSNITTYEIDEYTGNAAASMSLINPNYMKLAGRIVIDNHQKNTQRSFIDKMRCAYLRPDKKNTIHSLLSDKYFKYVEKHQDAIEKMIDYKRDFDLDYFGFRTFQRLYGIKIDGKIIERPQDLFMRTAIAIHMLTCDKTEEGLKTELSLIKKTYDMLSTKQYTQASTTYFNAGMVYNQFSSCFLLGTDDSRKGIMKTADAASIISKWGGGIGIHCNEWRGSGALIRSTNGHSSGIVPFLRIYNNVMRAFNQGGKRLGSAAIYLMPHHPDIMKFLQLKLPGGAEIDRAHDLFYAVWVPNIFMERVKNDELWSLFDPNETDDLSNYADYGNKKNYTEKYLELERKKVYTEQLRAREIWEAIYLSNVQTGVPYIVFSDWSNEMSNQQNLGVIKSSNLCSEIIEYSSANETAVCNLCSINLAKCVKDIYSPEELKQSPSMRRQLDDEFPINPYFDFHSLKDAVKIAVQNLDNIIDKNYYPTMESYRSNIRHRPIGIGMQGLANVFLKMRYPFDDPRAAKLNKEIAETMYYAALSQSTRICREKYQQLCKQCQQKKSVQVTYYTSFNYKEYHRVYKNPKDIPKKICAYPSMLWNGGSPISKGKFHWELYGLNKSQLSGMWDWETLRRHILVYGIRNSLLIALMPTASTSQLLGNNECFEPFTSNMYKRKTLAGEFIMINKYLINDLYKLKLWDKQIMEYLKCLEGSIQAIEGIPDEIKKLYKTVWEIDQSVLVQYAIDRQPFVDQSQSLNLYLENVSLDKFNKLIFQAWRGRLKTAKYYLHSRPAANPQKFTIDPKKEKEMKQLLEKYKQRATTDTFMKPLKNECDLCSG